MEPPRHWDVHGFWSDYRVARFFLLLAAVFVFSTLIAIITPGHWGYRVLGVVIATFVSMIVLGIYCESLPSYDLTLKRKYDFRDWLSTRLKQIILDKGYVIPTQEVWDRVLTIGDALYHHERELPDLLKEKRTPESAENWDKWREHWLAHDEPVAEAIVQSLAGFLKHLPPLTGGPFKRPLTEAVNTASLIWDMISPLRDDGGYLDETRVFKWITDRYNANVGILSKPGQPPMQPQRYDGPREEIAQAYFRGLPFLPLLQTLVGFQPFTEQQRFTHHWIMGHNGTGKTTYLRHLLKADLESVAKGECSLVVIDSKALIREMRTLQIFGPYNELDGAMRLVDADTPFPLNPFFSENPKGIVSYMLANLTEASELQTGAINFYINGTMASPEKNLRTMQKLIALPKDAIPTSIMQKLDPNTNHWFRNTRKTQAGLTHGGVAQRLDNFINEAPLLNKMFEANDFGLNIKELHEGGQVWLIDTNRLKFGKDGTNLLGRLIIALISYLSDYRTNLRGKHKPIWLFMDESQDYIAQDAIFADILEKARASNIGVTIAHQHLGQITDARVKGALENVGIKTTCEDVGSVQVKTRKDQFTLRVSPLEFKDEPQMRDEDYQYLREWMRFHFPYQPMRKAVEEVQEPRSYR